MFGRKKKTVASPKNIELDSTKSNFQIHTMQDDINAIANGGVAVQGATAGDLPQKKVVPKNDAASPFLNKEPAVEMKKKEESKLSSDNPFFAQGGVPDTSTPKPAPIIATEKPLQTKPSIKEVPSILDAKSETKDLSSKIKLDTDKNSDFKKPLTDIESEIGAFAAPGKTETSSNKSDFKIPPKSKMESDNGITLADDGMAKMEQLGKSSEQKTGNKKMAFVIAMIVLSTLLIAAALFGWYWWTKNKTTTNEGETSLELNPDDTDNGEINPVKRYAVDLPNYIEIIEGANAISEFQAKVDEISINMPLQEITTPISFLVTDAEGGPLTFRSFALLMGMDVPETILSAADDAFEIYAVREGDKVRFGLGLDVNDKITMQEAMLNAESQLPQMFTPLYNGLEYYTGGAFQDNVYGEYPIRFINLTEDESLSIDYAVAERVYIGTSRMSQRAILDHFGDTTPFTLNPEGVVPGGGLVDTNTELSDDLGEL